MARTKAQPNAFARELLAVRRDPYILVGFPFHLKDNVSFVMAAIQYESCYAQVIQWAAPQFRNEESLVRKVVQVNWRTLEYVAADFRGNRDIAENAISSSGGMALEFVSQELQTDQELVLKATLFGPQPLQFTAPSLRMDPNFMLMAVQQHGRSLQYAANEIKMDRTVVLAAVQNDGHAIKFAPDHFKDDFELVISAVQIGSLNALQIVSERLRANQQIVRAAVQNFGPSLEFASPELRSDRGIVLLAVGQSGRALEFASPELWGDREIVLLAVQQSGMALSYASPELRADREIVLTAVCGGSFHTLAYASMELRGDRDLVMMAVERNPNSLRFASTELKDDKEIALLALQREIDTFQFLSSRLQNELEVVQKAHWKDFQIFESDYWDTDLYCLELKARLRALGKAVSLAAQHYNLPLDDPKELCQGWFSIIYQKHWLVSQIDIPQEVQHRICQYSNESFWANELRKCEPLISRFMETDEEDWVALLGCRTQG